MIHHQSIIPYYIINTFDLNMDNDDSDILIDKSPEKKGTVLVYSWGRN